MLETTEIKKHSLVNYDSSNSDDEPEQKKLKPSEDVPAKKLPLPNFLKSSQTVDSIGNLVDDDPDEHDGRTRSFPHERGNWTTYVHIPCEEKGSFIKLCEQIQVHLENQLNLNLKNVNDYHVSLTRTVVLRHHWIKILMDSIREKLGICKRFTSNFNKLNVYCNDEKTRTFIGLTLAKDADDILKEIVHKLDTSLEEFKLPKFYTNPSFHMSILWCLGDYKALIEGELHELNKMLELIIVDDPDDFELFVSKLYCKCGNKKYAFELL